MRVADCMKALELNNKYQEVGRFVSSMESSGEVDIFGFGRFYPRGSAVFTAVLDALLDERKELLDQLAELGVEREPVVIPLGEEAERDVIFDVAKAQAVDPPVLPQAHGTM